MCVECERRPREAVVDEYRLAVRARGWAMATSRGSAGRAGFSYSIGLTRHHDHPELLTSGLSEAEAAGLLGTLAARVRAGARFGSGQVVRPDGPYRLQLVRVSDPLLLRHAQDVYAGWSGPVPALQVVWSDERGRWPWQQGWPGSPADQPLFGLPARR